MRRAWGVSLIALCSALLTGVPNAHASNDTFTASQAPSPSGDTGALRLNAVSCPSPGNCAAVGSIGDGEVIDVETDGTWFAVPRSSEIGTPATNLSAVSCPAIGHCVAVGTDGSQAVIEAQSGSTWTGIAATGPSGSGALYSSYEGTLSSVSCPAVGSCAAVGQAVVNNTMTGLEDTYGLIADLIPNNAPQTGSEWSAQLAPEYLQKTEMPPEPSSLAGVSCSKPGECRAVGEALDTSDNHYQYALVDDEKNYAWAYGAAAVPGDSNGAQAGLTAISCIGDTFNCMAAGYYSTAKSSRVPMIQTIDSKDTAEVTAGLVPIEDTSAELLATSCAGDGTCESVGQAYDSPGDKTYGYGYDGYIVSFKYGAPAGQSAGVIGSNTYSPGDANTVQHIETLTAASCASGEFCVAVGNYVDQNNDNAGVIDTRTYNSDGSIKSETDIRAPEPKDETSADDQQPLNGVSCNDSDHCVAVGSYFNDSQARGVIETLGGSSSTPPAPAVTKVSPSHGHTAGRTKVTVTGTNLTGATAVHFGTKLGTKLSVKNASTLVVTAPKQGAGRVDVRVTTSRGTSAVVKADHFIYIAKPSVTGVSPDKGSHRGGTKVTISGDHLSGATAVHFGSDRASDVKIVSSHKLTVHSPSHAKGTVDIRVTTHGGTSREHKSDHFRFR